MRLFAFLAFLISMSSCWQLRAYSLRHMQLTDYTKLPSVTIHKPSNSFHFIKASATSNIKAYLDTTLIQSRTAAFLVIRNDSIIYENYFNGFDHSSILPSNSMAKSFVGTLVGIAIDEGKIKSVNEPVTNYLPQLLKSDSNFSKITLQHLLDMRSGLKFNEGTYNLQDDAIRIGLRPNLRKHVLKVAIAEPPGRFKYQSINTQLLSLVIEKATGERLYGYLEEKIWKEIGMEHDATWNVDSKKRKQVLGSAGINAVAIDFAKLGRLYLREGEWQDRQVISKSWVQTISNIDTMEKYGGYKNQWWSRTAYHTFTDSAAAIGFQNRTSYSSNVQKMQDNYRVGFRTHSFGAIGFLNQAIYVNPEKNLIIVRLGLRWQHPQMNAVQFIHNLAERL